MIMLMWPSWPEGIMERVRVLEWEIHLGVPCPCTNEVIGCIIVGRLLNNLTLEVGDLQRA